MRLESEKQRKRSGTSGEKSDMKAKPCMPLLFIFDLLCFRLQGKGEGTAGGAEEAPYRRDRSPQKGN